MYFLAISTLFYCSFDQILFSFCFLFFPSSSHNGLWVLREQRKETDLGFNGWLGDGARGRFPHVIWTSCQPQRRVHLYFFISFIRCEVEGRKKEWGFKAVSSPIKDGARFHYIGAALFLGMLLGIKAFNAITKQSLILAFSSFHLPTTLCLTK